MKFECKTSEDDVIDTQTLIHYIDSIFNTKIGLHGFEICDLFNIQELVKKDKQCQIFSMEDIIKYAKNQIIVTRYNSMKNNEFDFIFLSKVFRFYCYKLK